MADETSERSAALLAQRATVSGPIRWPAAFGGTQRQLAPPGALLVTERELVVISEEKEPSARATRETPSTEEAKERFGGIITFVPRIRLTDFHVSHHEHVGVLALEIRAAHGGQKLEIVFAPDEERAVSKAIEQMLLSRGSAK